MIGHNNPPHAIAFEEARAFEADCLKLVINNEQDAALAAILIDREVKGRKAAEFARTTEKKPHLDAAKEVDECWKPVTDLYQKAVASVKSAVLAWRKQEAERIAKEQEDARLEAERAQEAAMTALSQATSGDVWAEIEAAHIVAKVDQAAEKAAHLESVAAPMQVKADGIRARGVKLVYSVDVIDAQAMTKALASNSEVQAAALKVANAMARTMKEAFTLDGCKVKATETI